VRALAPALVVVACAAHAQEGAPPPAAAESGHPSIQALGIHWAFSGQLVVNANYSSSTMVVGSIPAFELGTVGYLFLVHGLWTPAR
jgi:hypothetical protein